MSDGELEHLMSQLGKKIQTINAPNMLGITAEEDFRYEADQEAIREEHYRDYEPAIARVQNPPHTAKSGQRRYPEQPRPTYAHAPKWNNIPQAGDTHYPGGKKAYWHPLPPDFDWHTHKSSGVRRKTEIPRGTPYVARSNKKKPDADETAPLKKTISEQHAKIVLDQKELQRLTKRVTHLELENTQLKAKVQKIASKKSITGKPKNQEKLLSGATTPKRTRLNPQAPPYGYNYDAQQSRAQSTR